MKSPMLAGIVFAAALAGSAGLRMATAPVPAPADSAQTVAHGDSALAAPDSVTVPARPSHGSSAVTAVADSVPHQPATRHETTPGPEIAHAGPDTGRIRPDYARLAKLLGVMPTALASERIALLNDTEVEGILRALGMRQAAALLAAMPKERAAAIARRLLVPRDSGATK